MASVRDEIASFSWLALIFATVVLALLIPLFYFVTTIPGLLSHNESQMLQAICCNDAPPTALISVVEITIGAGLILIPIFLWPVIEFRNESPFASFWRRIEESNAKKTAPSKSQMAGALLLPGVVILLAVSMYFVGFLVH